MVEPFWVVESDPESNDLLVISNDPTRPVLRLEPYNKTSFVDTGYAAMLCALLNQAEELALVTKDKKRKKVKKK
jgi:hypothetical protein